VLLFIIIFGTLPFPISEVDIGSVDVCSSWDTEDSLSNDNDWARTTEASHWAGQSSAITQQRCCLRSVIETGTGRGLFSVSYTSCDVVSSSSSSCCSCSCCSSCCSSSGDVLSSAITHQHWPRSCLCSSCRLVLSYVYRRVHSLTVMHVILEESFHMSATEVLMGTTWLISLLPDSRTDNTVSALCLKGHCSEGPLFQKSVNVRVRVSRLWF